MSALVAVGKPYPGRVVEGLMLDLFGRGGTLLRVGAPGWERQEVRRLQKGKPRVDVADAGDGVLLAAFAFDGLEHGAAPFDARLARDAGHLELPDLGPETRIVVMMHVVDTATGVCRGIREWTLTPATSARVVEIVQRRLATGPPSGPSGEH